ncbi:unnamed protein product [Diatraea saccharalis]|uniref:C2H2-type domain-containing protein n=1 Tax=Diatraea saccharalis TaxID=40085 RepID=A0A9N9R148_9NEOP|nr:unnamed protein product [Diatraea saccharalis]
MATLSKWVPVGADTNKQNIDQKLKLTTIDLVGGIYCNICHITFGNKKEFDSHYTQHGSGNADIVYTCVVCHKEIIGYPSFRGHCYLAHVTKDRFKCEHCHRMFSKQTALQSHIKSMHQTIIKCLICQKTFQCQKELLLHKMIHKNTENGPPYECQTCGDRLETSDDCENHIEDHCSMFYFCPICNEDIINLQYAASHLTKHFGNVLNEKKPAEDVTEIEEISNDSSLDLIGGILCCYCNSTYRARQDFDNHITTDHPDRDIVYACNICGKEFEKYFNFTSHCYDHTAKDRFQCEECSKTFPRLSLLVIHMEAYHSNTKTSGDAFPFTCLQCNHGFKTDRRLKDHYRNVHKDHAYYSQCPEQGCGKTFDAPKDLILHLKEHNSVHNWCKQCGLRFYSLKACEKHLQYHKKKLYSCPVCSKNYGEKYLVVKHVHQHFSAVLHVCKVCGKIYNGRNRLVQHMKVHNEVKPHICSFCGKGFTKTYLLQQHLNVHTGLKPFKCTNCPKTFASYPNLRKHQRNIHNVAILNTKRVLNENNNHNTSNKAVDEVIKENEKTMLDHDPSEEVTGDINDTIGSPEVDLSIVNTSVDMISSTTHNFEESNESMNQWILNSSNSSAIEMLAESIENQQGANIEVTNIDEFQKELWVSNSSIPTDWSQTVVPYEYGPEFVFGAEAEGAGAGVIPLGDPPLPHIDPRLTLLNPPTSPFSPSLDPSPVLTKLESPFDFDTARFVINTDIF